MAVALLASVLVPTTAQALTVRREAIQSARCTVAEARLQIRIDRVAREKTQRTETYETLQTKVNTAIDTAEGKGYDTTDLVAARANVQEKIDIYTQKATAYTTALQTTKDYACGESDGAFASALADARLALTQTRQAAIDVRVTFRSDAIPALQDYINWLKIQNN